MVGAETTVIVLLLWVAAAGRRAAVGSATRLDMLELRDGEALLDGVDVDKYRFSFRSAGND